VSPLDSTVWFTVESCARAYCFMVCSNLGNDKYCQSFS